MPQTEHASKIGGGPWTATKTVVDVAYDGGGSASNRGISVSAAIQPDSRM
jgi:hypothetical protein